VCDYKEERKKKLNMVELKNNNTQVLNYQCVGVAENNSFLRRSLSEAYFQIKALLADGVAAPSEFLKRS
jgi:hypothetical protein